MICVKLIGYFSVQTLIAGCFNLGEIATGYMVGWSAPIIPKLLNPEETPLPYLISEFQQSWIASTLYIGCIGTFAVGFFANKIGRKKTLLIGEFIVLLSNIVLATAKSLTMIYIGRFLIGVGGSMVIVTELIYIGETMSPHIRGFIMTTLGVSHALGSLLVYCVGPFVSYAEVGYIVISLNVAVIAASCFLPESPMFYVIKNDEASARSAFQNLSRESDIDTELKNMMQRLQDQQQQKEIWRELFTMKSNRISLFITVSLSFFQQCSGIIAVIFFTTTIFTDAGSSVRPDIATIIVGATFVFGSCVSPMFIEKQGRRLLLMVSTGGCCLSMTILGLYFYLKMIKNSYIINFGWVPLISLVFAIFIYSVGLSIIPNTIIGEVFTPKVRSLGSSISLTAGWMLGLLSIVLFSYALVAFGSHVAFWIFATINGVAFVFVMVFVPETKGKNLVEILMMLEHGSGQLKKAQNQLC